LKELTVIVEFVLFPAAVVAEVGLIDNPKSLTTSVNGTLRPCPLLVPVTVTV
jgi:hypothetical protein